MVGHENLRSPSDSRIHAAGDRIATRTSTRTGSAAALTAAEQDVTAPWLAGTTTTQKAVLTRTKKTRTFTVATQLDGTLKMTLKPSAGMRLSVDVFASTTRAAHVVSARAVSRTLTVCGARSYRFRVTELAGRGTVSLTVAKP